MSDTLRNCPKCGGPIPNEAPQGLCPKCVLEQASFATESGQPTDQKSAPPSLEELALAFPHLQIIEMIGQGGMGFVFKARQPKLERFVALKILPQTLALDPAFAERFQREARVLAKLNHPNIVTIFDFGQAGGFFFLLMEFVDGVNLRQAMKLGRFTPAQALDIVPKICDALHFAHNEGILHRDIKPENILLDSRGRVKIADFGIAKILGTEAATETKAVGPQQQNVTGIVGTPNYMAPEQLERPSEVDQRADIYSLGVVFYEMLTGELPTGSFVPPSKKSPVDPRVDDVVQRTLERERERRQKSADEVRTQVETIVEHPQQAQNALPREYEYRSKRTLLGIPLLHVTWDFNAKKLRTARGLVAIGPRAIGLVAIGFEAYGLFPAGILALGVAPVGALAIGAASVGLVSFGLQATGLIGAGESVTALKHLHGGFDALLMIGISWALAGFAQREIFKQLKAAVVTSVPPVIGGSSAPASAAPDRFWKKFAVVIAAVIVTPILIGILALLAAIVIPAISKAQKKAEITRAIPVAPSAPTAPKPALPIKPAKPTVTFPHPAKLKSTDAFGPVIERVIQAPESRTNMFLDLTHGTMFTPSAEIVEVVEQSQANKDRAWTSRDISNGQRAYRYVQWIQENGIDLMFLPPSNEFNQPRVITFDCTMTPAHGENSTNWENLDAVTPHQLERAIGVLNYMRDSKEAARYGRPAPKAPAEGGVFGAAPQLDLMFPDGRVVNQLALQDSRLWFFETRAGTKGVLELSQFNKDPWSVKIRYKLLQPAKRAEKVDPTHKRMTFARPELQITNDVMTVSISSDTPMVPCQHFSALLELPNGELRTHSFSMVTNRTHASSVISWQFDPKHDGFWTAAAQDAVSQMGANLARPHTFQAGEILPVFSVTNSSGGVMTGSIEYHVHLPQPATRRGDAIVANQ